MKEQIEEMRKDLIEIFDEEYEKRRLITPDFTAEKMTAKGYRKQEWISVDDRLPDEDGEYLTWSGLIYFPIWFNASLGLWNVVGQDGDISTAIRGVTHWMPIPEPPKMKGGAE